MAKITLGQLYSPTTWNKLTHENHIFSAFGGSPQYLGNIMRYLQDVNTGASFVRWSDDFPTMEVEANQAYKWKLKGVDKRNIPLQAAWADELGTVAITSVSKPGYGSSQFYMDFPEDHFSTTEVIHGRKRDMYHLRIMGEPISIANGTRYRVQLVTDNDAHFIPASELFEGSRWVGTYALSEKYGSKTGADISFSTPFEMEERPSFLRMRHEVFGEMIDAGKNKPLTTYLKDSTGKVHMYWINYMEFIYFQQFESRLAHLTFYGKSTVNDKGQSLMKGESGNEVIAGRGIREQFSPANKYYYNTMTFDRLTKLGMDITVGKIDMSNRTMVVGTGEYGLNDLHKMCVSELGSNDYRWLNDSKGQGYKWSGNDIHVNFGQIKGFAHVNGINYKFVHYPHYDDPVTNIMEHPEGGTMESRRFTIMDYGTQQDPNIVKIRIKGRKPIYNIIPGFRDPFNPGGLSTAYRTSGEVDSYVMNTGDWQGAAVIDPNRVIEAIHADSK